VTSKAKHRVTRNEIFGYFGVTGSPTKKDLHNS